jgi:formylglycine-generating enzyme required for sulfatase activity
MGHERAIPGWSDLRGRANSHRVVRGGAFNNNQRNVRCAYRNNRNPDNRNDNNGFRVVVAHAFPYARTAQRFLGDF